MDRIPMIDQSEKPLELTEGHKRAIVSMFASGTSIRQLAEWYRVSQDEIREVLKPHVRLVKGR